MYTEKDLIEINGKIKKNYCVIIPIVVVLLAVFVTALIVDIKWLAMGALPAAFVAGCYGILAYLVPNSGYRRFLLDMEEGLAREMKGSIVEIGETADLQDGVRVLPVRIFLEEEQDERIVYLNASKLDIFPKAGTDVILSCYGRHIRTCAVKA